MTNVTIAYGYVSTLLDDDTGEPLLDDDTGEVLTAYTDAVHGTSVTVTAGVSTNVTVESGVSTNVTVES